MYLKDCNSKYHQPKMSFSIIKVYYPTQTQEFSNIEVGHQGATENFPETLMLSLKEWEYPDTHKNHPKSFFCVQACPGYQAISQHKQLQHKQH